MLPVSAFWTTISCNCCRHSPDGSGLCGCRLGLYQAEQEYRTEHQNKLLSQSHPLQELGKYGKQT